MSMRLEARNIAMLAYTYYALDARVRREAEALQSQGYSVDVVCLHRADEPSYDVQRGVRVYRVPYQGYRNSGTRRYIWGYLVFAVLAALWLCRLFWRRRYAAIQVHTLPDFLIFAVWPFKALGVRLALDMHDPMPELFASRFGQARGFLFNLLVLVERWSVRVADAVFIVHQRHYDILVERGIPPDKMTIVMNCADERIFDPARHALPVSPGDEFVVLYHGSVVERYGLDTLVRAAARVAPDIPALRVHIVGSGDFEGPLRDLVATLGLEGVVHMESGVPHEQIPPRILAADACVVPMRDDLFTDLILPVKLLEAVAMCRPVVSSRTRNIERYFDDRALCYFTPGDPDDLARSIRAIATDPVARERYAVEASRQARPYRWSEAKAGYLAAVAVLADQGHRGGGADAAARRGF